jgi:hypothetical protein
MLFNAVNENDPSGSQFCALQRVSTSPFSAGSPDRQTLPLESSQHIVRSHAARVEA